MTTIEHLQKIKAKCEQLLAIAEKRTPVEWRAVSFARCAQPHDALFIASCAGAAESGWRSTIAAIDGLERGFHDMIDYRTITAITSAWPIELL